MIILRKYFSNREVVPKEIAERGKKEGVIQKDNYGNWRIISFKTNPPNSGMLSINQKKKLRMHYRLITLINDL